MSEGRATQPPVLGSLQGLGALFHENRLPMWIHDGSTLRILVANRAARSAYQWDDDTLTGLTIDDVKPRGIVSAQEFWSDSGPVWVVTELDGAEQAQQEAEHDRVLDELLEAQEQLRGSIAERLHDGPVQTLTALSLRLGLLKRAVDASLEPKVTEIERLAVDALASLRSEMNRQRGHGEIATDLRGAIASTVRWLGLEDRYDVEATGDEPSGRIGAMLYRIAQDLLASSPADPGSGSPRTIRVHVSRVAARLTVEVADGVVLSERLAAWAVALGGGVDYVQQDGRTSVVVTVPVSP